MSSRLSATKLLVKAINALPPAERPRSFVSSSAIGYYGTSESSEFAEGGPAGRDFLANLCQQARCSSSSGASFAFPTAVGQPPAVGGRLFPGSRKTTPPGSSASGRPPPRRRRACA